MAKGRKTGGRQAATLNKRTIALREAAAAVGTSIDAPASILLPRRKNREIIERFRDELAEMARRYRIAPPDDKANAKANHEKYLDCVALAVKCASILQEYDEPKLKAIMVASSTGMGGQAEVESNVVKLPAGDPVRAGRVYRMLIDGAPARKTG